MMSAEELFAGNPDFIDFLWDLYMDHLSKKWKRTRDTLETSLATVNVEDPDAVEYQAAMKTMGALSISLQVIDTMITKFSAYSNDEKYEHIAVSLFSPFFGVILENLEKLDPGTFKSVQETAESLLKDMEQEEEEEEDIQQLRELFPDVHIEGEDVQIKVEDEVERIDHPPEKRVYLAKCIQCGIMAYNLKSANKLFVKDKRYKDTKFRKKCKVCLIKERKI